MIPGHDTLPDLLRRQRFAIAAALVIGILATINWIQDPELAGRWLRKMLILPVACVLFTLWTAWMGRSRPSARTDEARRTQDYFDTALMLIVVAVGIRQIAVLGLEIWIRIGDHGADLDFERRILGLATAAIFVVLGNALPKILTPLSMLPVHLAEQVRRARRFIGAIWVLLGLAMTIAFVALPLALAISVERGSFIAGMLTIVAGIVWMNLSPARGGR